MKYIFKLNNSIMSPGAENFYSIVKHSDINFKTIYPVIPMNHSIYHEFGTYKTAEFLSCYNRSIQSVKFFFFEQRTDK